METKGGKKERLLIIGLPVLLSLLFFLLPLIFRQPLYCLNDDLQIAGILSGALSGSPDLHTVYVRAPLSFILSLLYRWIPSFPWFGAFLCFCIVLSFYLLLRSVFRELLEGNSAAIRTAAGIFLMAAFYLLYFRTIFIMPHYTLVAAVCGAAGIWLLVTGREGFTPCLLLILCDQIRSQVFLMLLPFALLAFALKLYGEKTDGSEGFLTEERKKLLHGFGVFCACFALLFGLHKAAYLTPVWAEYLKLNDARTELYDYAGVWESDTAKDYYERCGMDTETTLPLYLQYDLLPDEDARAERLSTLAIYREPGRSLSGIAKLKNVLYELKERSLKTDAVYAWPMFLAMIAGLALALAEKDLPSVLAAGAGICLHFGLYGYLLWNGRSPERVTVSLYLFGTMFAAGLSACRKKQKARIVTMAAMALGLLTASFFLHPGEDYREQITVNQTDDVLYSYMAEHSQELFLLETYATVYRTTTVAEEGKQAANVLLMGGWQYGSPLQEEKLARFGYEDRKALFAKGGAKIVFREGVGLSPDELGAFLEQRYPEGGRLTEEARLSSGETDTTFLIYGME